MHEATYWLLALQDAKQGDTGLLDARVRVETWPEGDIAFDRRRDGDPLSENKPLGRAHPKEALIDGVARRLVETINEHLASSTHAQGEWDGTRFRLGGRAHNLLGAMWWQMLNDLALDREIKFCRACGKPFAIAHGGAASAGSRRRRDAAFCSRTCTDAYYNAYQRKKPTRASEATPPRPAGIRDYIVATWDRLGDLRDLGDEDPLADLDADETPAAVGTRAPHEPVERPESVTSTHRMNTEGEPFSAQEKN
jgi:hypothetical protein